MKKILLFTLFIFLIIFLWENFSKNGTFLSAPAETPHKKVSSNGTSNPRGERKSIYVPYWTIANILAVNEYDQIVYFGIAPSVSGIDTSDPGYTSLSSFVTSVPKDKKTLLTLRMLDSKEAFAIIESKSSTQKVIEGSIATAKEYGFDGIVLDLEVKSLPFDSVLQNISSFQKTFYEETRKNNLTFTFAIYGDTFYRIRPFNVKDVGMYADTVMIMAYDFSKAGGADPGPNFPYAGKETYGYDFQKMIDDFSSVIPPEKLEIVFGMYGYDWQVTDNGKTVTTGQAMSVNKIENFISSCSSCVEKRDSTSGETQITYTDVTGKAHILWYEDTKSVEVKKTYAKEKGITKFSYWAYSYF